MGLRCLIGHDYGPPETEREREERGGEVVVTIREFKECERCGDRQVISENTEVRAKDPNAGRPSGTTDGTSPEATSPDATPEGSAGTRSEDYDEVSAREDDGVILSDDGEGDAPGEWPDTDDHEGDDSGAETDDPATGADTDAESDVEESGEWSGRERTDAGEVSDETSEWPDVDDHEPEDDSIEHREWPDAEGEDEGYDAVAGDDATADDVEFGGGLTPERTGEGETEADAAEVTPAGITSASPGPEPIGPQRSDDGATTLVCPECDHVVEGASPSLRPGDICPECRRGYLAERDAE